MTSPPPQAASSTAPPTADGPSLLARMAWMALAIVILHVPLWVFGLTAAGLPLRLMSIDAAVGVAILLIPIASMMSLLWVPFTASLIGWMSGRITPAILAGIPLMVTRAAPFVYLTYWAAELSSNNSWFDTEALVALSVVGSAVAWLALLILDSIMIPVAAGIGRMRIIRYSDWDLRRAGKATAWSLALTTAMLVVVVGPSLCLSGADWLFELTPEVAVQPELVPGEPVVIDADAEVRKRWIQIVGGVIFLVSSGALTFGVAVSRLRLAVPLGLTFATIAPVFFSVLLLSKPATSAAPFAWLVVLPVVSAFSLGGFLYGFFFGALGFTMGWMYRGSPALDPIPEDAVL